MNTRIIHTDFWEDAKVLEMSPRARYLFLYYFSNSAIGHIGIFKIAKTIVLLQTGLEESQVITAKEELESLKIVRFYEDWIYVVNSQKLSGYTGPLNEKAREKELLKIPSDALKHFRLLGHQIPYGYPMDSSINQKTETTNNKRGTENQEQGSVSVSDREEDEINIEDLEF
ncbi:MAG: hypothetical protein WCG99_03490 [Candidatus Berkelbacteria bacterium]